MPTKKTGLRIAKASSSDFDKVYDLLKPMEELFNSHWNNEEEWTEWDDEDPDKQELLRIRKEIADDECEGYEEDVDNRLILFEFIKRRMHECGCSNWQRVVIAAQTLIDTFCDPQDDALAWSPEIERAMNYTMLGE